MAPPTRVWQSVDMGDELAKKVEAVIQYYVRQGLLKGEKEIGETRDLFTRANREQIQQMFLLELASNADDDREEIETVFLPLLKIKAMEEAKDFFDTETHVAVDEQNGNVETSTKLKRDESAKWTSEDQLIDDFLERESEWVINKKLEAWNDAKKKKIPRYAFTRYENSVCVFVEKATTRSSQFELEVFSTDLSEEEIMKLRAVQENSIDGFWQDWTPFLEQYALPFFPNGEIGIYQGEDKKRIDALIRHIKRRNKRRLLDVDDHKNRQWELIWDSYRPTLFAAHWAIHGGYQHDAAVIKKFLKQLEDAWLWVDYEFMPGVGMLNLNDEEGLKQKLKHALDLCRDASELLSFAEKYKKFARSPWASSARIFDIFTMDDDLLQETVRDLLNEAGDTFAEVFPT